MKRAMILGATMALLLGLGCGGKKDDSKGGKSGESSKSAIATAEKEFQYGSYTIKGQFPTDWTPGPMGDYQLKGTAEGLDDMVLAAIDFDSYGGTGWDEAKLKAEMEKRKNDLINLEIAGRKGELVEDLAEVTPGVFRMVIKTPDFANDKSWEFNVTTFHMMPEGESVLMCKGRSRLTKVDLWKSLKPICAGLTFSLTK